MPSNNSASMRTEQWLKDSIALWSHRTDLGEVIPDLIVFAETRLNDDIRAKAMNSVVTIDTVAGEAAALLPADVAEIRSLSAPTYGPLEFVTAERFNTLYPESRSGVPRHYMLNGRTITFGPTPEAAYSLVCSARRSVPALADSNGTNWLIEQRADIYLAAAMCEAMNYTKDGPGKQLWEAKYATALSSLNASEWDQAGPLTVRLVNN